MKTTVITITILLMWVISTFAQPCLPDGIWFSTQSQIDSFPINYPNCSEIEGEVKIKYGDDITNLNGLSVITSIGSNLIIDGNNSLTNLLGLENLTFIGGSVYISQNDDLNNLEGLNNLSLIGGYLSVYWNPALESLSGMNNLSSIGEDFYISSNPSLTSLTGLDNLNSIGGTLRISNCDLLINFSGIDNLTSIGGGLGVWGNDTLKSLTGIHNISAASITDLSIFNNPLLYACGIQSVCNYLSSPTGSVNIYNNAVGCNNPAKIADSCGITLQCFPYGNYYFTSQDDIDNFQSDYPNCTELSGNVTIRGDTINNLIGLNSLISIEGELNILWNDSLTTLIGLDNLAFIGENLYIIDNDALTTLVDWNNLSSIGGELWIEDNDNLSSLSGFQELDLIAGNLILMDNESLTSLSGLDNIDPDSIIDLMIVENDCLSICHVNSICEYLANPNGDTWIGYNDMGCNTPMEVLEACSVVIPEQLSDHHLSVYPNPFTTSTTIDYELSDPSHIQLMIYNSIGEEVYRAEDRLMPVGKHTFTWGAERLPEGMYYGVLRSEEGVSVVKMVKQ